MTDLQATGRHASIQLTLSDAQVEEVLRGLAAKRSGGLHELILARVAHLKLPTTDGERKRKMNPKLSLAVLRAFTILRLLSLAEEEQSLYDIARGIAESTSTTRRYLLTLRRVGLIDQSDHTRKYRLAPTPITRTPERLSPLAELAHMPLDAGQVEEVLREAARTGRGGLRGLLAVGKSQHVQLGPRKDGELPDDRTISRSLLRALLIVRFLFLAGGSRPIFAIAPGVGLSHSTTHRYLATLKEIELVEQVEATSEYRLVRGQGVR